LVLCKTTVGIPADFATWIPKGKTVYRGGRIVPDVFVAIDTTRYFGDIHYRLLNEFVFNDTDTHRKYFENLSLEGFLNSYYIECQLYE